jgi:hypothetical protein
MAEWHAFVEDDAEGDACVYLQIEGDDGSRELFERVEPDSVDHFAGHDDEFIAAAEDEAQRRNALPLDEAPPLAEDGVPERRAAAEAVLGPRASNPGVFDTELVKRMDEELRPRLDWPTEWVKAALPGPRAVYDGLVAAAIPGAEAAIEAWMKKIVDGGWPTLDDCIPPGTLLDDVDKAFVATSDVPRELPFFAAIHYVSALLLQRGIHVKTRGRRMRPDLWCVCLAPSGAGKTFAQSEVRKAFGDGVDMFPDTKTTLRFIQNLEHHNLAMWPKDEFGQLLSGMEHEASLRGLKAYLLECEQGSTITWNSGARSISVKDPGLTIFASTVLDTFPNHLTREMILDGFAQRFALVVADRDPARKPIVEYFFEEDRAPAVAARWQGILAGVEERGPRYRVNQVAHAAYQRAFEIVLRRAAEAGVQDGYSRRLVARGMKYALVYHVLLGKTGDMIDEEDLGYGMRLIMLHMRDLRTILDFYPAPAKRAPVQSERDRQLRAVEAYLGKARDGEWPPVDARKLLGNVKSVKGGDLARALMREAVEADPTLAPYADCSPAKPGAAVAKARATNPDKPLFDQMDPV